MSRELIAKDQDIRANVKITGSLDVLGTIGSKDTVPAFEDLSAGDYVDLFDDSGTRKARLAIADDKINPKRAEAYITVSVTAGNSVDVFTGGTNINVSGLSAVGGNTVYLSPTVPGGVTELAPSGPNEFAQPLGTGITAGSMNVDIDSVPGSGGDEDRLPLENKTTTVLDTNYRQGNYAEVLMGFSKQDKSTLFIDVSNGFLTRRINNSFSVSGGNAIALSMDNTLFHCSNPSSIPKLTRLDPVRDNATFIVNLIMPAELVAAGAPTAMDFHPANDVLFSVMGDVSDSSGYLATIDPIGGVVVSIGNMGLSASRVVDAIAIDPTDPTKAFVLAKSTVVEASGFDGADLYSLDLETGVVTFIGDTGHDRGSSLAFNAAGVLYAVLEKRIGGGTERLYTINTGTGAAAEVGLLFYEEQFPGASSHSVTDLTFRRLSTAGSELSAVHHNSLETIHEYGVVNAYKGALHPPPPELFDHMELNFITTIPNNAAVTFNLNEKGDDAMVNRDGTALSTGAILADVPYRLQRDQANTRWKILNPGS